MELKAGQSTFEAQPFHRAASAMANVQVGSTSTLRDQTHIADHVGLGGKNTGPHIDDPYKKLMEVISTLGSQEDPRAALKAIVQQSLVQSLSNQSSMSSRREEKHSSFNDDTSRIIAGVAPNIVRPSTDSPMGSSGQNMVEAPIAATRLARAVFEIPLDKADANLKGSSYSSKSVVDDYKLHDPSKLRKNAARILISDDDEDEEEDSQQRTSTRTRKATVPKDRPLRLNHDDEEYGQPAAKRKKTGAWNTIDIGYKISHPRYFHANLRNADLSDGLKDLIRTEDHSTAKDHRRANQQANWNGKQCWMAEYVPLVGFEGPNEPYTSTSPCGMCLQRLKKEGFCECCYFTDKISVIKVFTLRSDRG